MKKEILREQSKIVLNKRAGANYLEIALESPKIADICLPGQFIEIRISSTLDPLLRRPFSIHRISHHVTTSPPQRMAGPPRILAEPRHQFKLIEVLYEIVGKGTEIISQKKPGEYLDIIGPLGHGFISREPRNPCLPAGRENRKPILVAGGMGVAPLLFLADRLVHSPQSTVHGKPLVVIGAKTKTGVLCEQEFKKLGCVVKVATDDGTKGFKGRVTDLLERILSTMDRGLSPPKILAGPPSIVAETIYACGPKPMLKVLTQISKQYNIPAQISLESHMACGIGACLGCVVSTSGGFKRVCKDGPVFNAEEIIW